ncbi:MAG: dockerin type I repeat-containing protein [Phycisphaerales bacterium]|jgi:hypothetical protein
MFAIRSSVLLSSLALGLGIALPSTADLVEAELVAREGGPAPGGDGTTISALNAPFANGLGQVGFTGTLASGDRFVWLGDEIVWLNSDALPGSVLTGSESTMGISNLGGWIYSCNDDGEDSVWTQEGLLLRETEPIPGETLVWSSFNSRPRMTCDGEAFWVTGLAASSGGGTYGRGFMQCLDPADPASSQLLIGTGDPVEDGDVFFEIGSIGFAYDVSGSTEHIALIPRVAGAPPATDDFIWLDGVPRERQGDPTSPGSGLSWDQFRGVGVNDEGRLIFFGPAEPDDPKIPDIEYLALDGEIIVREGDSIGGVELSDGFGIRWAEIDDADRIVHVWEASGFPPTAGATFLTSETEEGFEHVAIVEIGDELDFDGDGIADGVVVDFEVSSVVGPAIGLPDQPWVFLPVEVEAAKGETYSAIVRFPLPGTDSPADLNGDGQVNGADLSILLAAWGGGGIADLNGDGVVDGADLAILLADWSN